MTGWLQIVARYRRAVLALHLAGVLVLLPGVLRLGSDNSPHVFFPREAEALSHYGMLLREFGGGQAVRLTLGGEGMWTSAALDWIADFEKRAAALETVQMVVGPVSQARWAATEWPPADLELFRADLRAQGRGYLKGWVSPQADQLSLVITFDVPGDARRAAPLDRLMELASTPPPGVSVRITGLPVLERAVDREVAIAIGRYFPLLVLMAVLLLLALSRRPADVASPLTLVGVCLLMTFGLMGFAGERLNLINVLLAPLLFVIALATAMHVLMHVQRARGAGLDAFEAVEDTYRSKGWPVLWTGLTTFIAFGSLVTARVPVLIGLGLWAAAGIAIMTVFMFTLYPALLLGGGKKAAPRQAWPFDIWASRNGRALATWSVRHRRVVVLLTVLTLIAGMWGLFRIRVEDNVAAYLREGHPVRRDLVALDAAGMGVFPADLVLTYRESPAYAVTDGTGFQNPTALEGLAKVSALARADPLVVGALGPGDLLDAAVRSVLVSGEAGDSLRWMTLGLLQTVPESRALLRSFLTMDGQSARIAMLVPVLRFPQVRSLLERLQIEAARAFPGATIFITGEYPLILQAQQQLLSGLVSSISTTVLAVALVFLVLLRHFRRTLLVLIPNVWPAVLALGAMGWLGVRLDSATVMTASIILGLAVDDTLHTLGHLRELSGKVDAGTAIEATLGRTAPAQIITSVVLTMGFAVVSMSDLMPVSRFGAVAAFGILLALVGDLVIVPALFASVTPGGAVRLSAAGPDLSEQLGPPLVGPESLGGPARDRLECSADR